MLPGMMYSAKSCFVDTSYVLIVYSDIVLNCCSAEQIGVVDPRTSSLELNFRLYARGGRE